MSDTGVLRARREGAGRRWRRSALADRCWDVAAVPLSLPPRDAPGAELRRQILAGGRHDPVVYFTRIGGAVKIGTTTNLTMRMNSFYLTLDDVLAVVPGGKDMEDVCHQRFAASLSERDRRRELFHPDLRLRFFLARWRCTWTEIAGCAGMYSVTAVATGSVFLGAVAFAVCMLLFAGRPGWEWR